MTTNRPEPKGRDDDHIFDYTKITEDIYIGSDLCKGGVCPIHGEEFKELGVKVEINLSAERNEKPPDFIDSYTWIPVVDGYSPTQSDLDVGTYLMKRAIDEGKTVYVHCKNGHGRSPTMVAAYLIRYEGYTPEEAEKMIEEKRPEVHIEENQKKELRKFTQKWSK